jgi:hypothetical protein
MDPLAARIIRLESGPHASRRPARPVLLRNPVGRRSSRPLAIYVTWLDELPGARR